VVELQGCRCKDDEERYIKAELVRCVKTLFSKGYVSSGGGNHSIRIKHGEDHMIWITPSGYPRSHLTVDDLVLIDKNGNVLRGDLRPSIETPFHTEIYRVRSDVNGVSHAHSPYSHAVIQTLRIKEEYEGIYSIDDELPIDVPEVIGDVPVLEYRQLGSRALARLVGDTLMLKPNTKIMVLLDHGVIGVGACIHEAMMYVQLLEEWARCVVVSIRLDKG
jgi:L-fuculose-phosphate aldolase